MKITWDELTVNFESITEDIVSDWRWLVGDSAKPVLISSLGDIFLQEKSKEVFWLNVTDGIYEKVADNGNLFESAILKNVDDWFVPELVAELLKNGQSLATNQCFSFIKSPVLGGEYGPENFEPTDLSVHFSIQGQIHEQVKNLPEGAPIGEIKLK